MSDQISPAKLIFRDNAVRSLNDFVNLDEALTLIKPASWLTLLCITLFLSGLLIWGIWGTIEITVPAVGIIIADKELLNVEKLWQENINDHQEKLNVLHDLFNKQSNLYQKKIITIAELERARENYLLAKDEVAALSRQNPIAVFKPVLSSNKNDSYETLDALIFVHHSLGKKVAKGMNSYILPDTLSAYEYGYIKGQVISVSDYPVAKDTVYGYLGNMSLADEFFGSGAPFIVKVRLTKDMHTTSGLAWTSRMGPGFAIGVGNTVSVKVIYKTCSPLELVFKTLFS